MNTPTWMMDAAPSTPQRAKAARHQRRSSDRRSAKVVDLALAFAAMVVTTWLFTQLNALLLR